MAYTSGNTIEATHYNGFVTSVNALWGVGTSNRGLGQTTTLSAVSAGNTVTAAQWATLLDRSRSVSDQYGQDGSITVDTVSNPTTGDSIAAYATIAADIATLDAAAVAVTTAPSYVTAVTDTASTAGNFKVLITQTDTLTFASAAGMRYFFNAGGKVTTSYALSGHTSRTKANEWATLVSACGTYQLFNTTGGKTGGSGSPTTNLTTTGFWDLGTTDTVMFKQTEDSSPYTANFLQVEMKLNAVPGSSTVLTIKTTWNDASTDSTYDAAASTNLDIVDGTKVTTFSYEASAATYITATWGTPAWATITNTES